MQNIQVYDNHTHIGDLKIYSNTYFVFEYVKNYQGFAIDPNLTPSKENKTFQNNKLWGCFEDISPDRWGRILQNRNNGRSLYDYEYMLGVSDYYRIGSLRLKIGNEFVKKTHDIPKLIHINELMKSSLNVEKENYKKSDIDRLLEPSSSLGGARIKASVLDEQNRLCIAKFASIKDEHSVILWEKTMLDLAKIAKIQTPNSKLISAKNNEKILLVERFDRLYGEKEDRIPFISAMTLLSVNEREDADKKSYVDFAQKLCTQDKQKLFKRMLFNSLFGNTDDHLRNHALLYDRKAQEWRLSPAYDLNPNPLAYERQFHALNFIENINKPSLKLCMDIMKNFEVNALQFNEILSDCIYAGGQYKQIATKNGITADEIKFMAKNFEHKDIQFAKEIIAQTFEKNLNEFLRKEDNRFADAKIKDLESLNKQYEILKKENIPLDKKLESKFLQALERNHLNLSKGR